MGLRDECLDSLDGSAGALSRHVRRTLGEEARTRFLRDGHVFGWLAGRGDALAAGPATYQYRYVCGQCREWWGIGLSPEQYHDAAARAGFEGRAAQAFQVNCPHIALRAAESRRGEE